MYVRTCAYVGKRYASERACDTEDLHIHPHQAVKESSRFELYVYVVLLMLAISEIGVRTITLPQ